jgi:hypothetical protein
MVVGAIIGVLLISLLLAIFKVVSIPVATVVVIVGLFMVVAIGNRRDRARHRGRHDPGRRLDGNRSALPASGQPEPLGHAAMTQTDVSIVTQPPRDDSQRNDS